MEHTQRQYCVLCNPFVDTVSATVSLASAYPLWHQRLARYRETHCTRNAFVSQQTTITQNRIIIKTDHRTTSHPPQLPDSRRYRRRHVLALGTQSPQPRHYQGALPCTSRWRRCRLHCGSQPAHTRTLNTHSTPQTKQHSITHILRAIAAHQRTQLSTLRITVHTRSAAATIRCTG